MYCYTGSLRFIITFFFLSAWLPGNRYPTVLSLTKRNRLCADKKDYIMCLCFLLLLVLSVLFPWPFVTSGWLLSSLLDTVWLGPSHPAPVLIHRMESFFSLFLHFFDFFKIISASVLCMLLVYTTMTLSLLSLFLFQYCFSATVLQAGLDLHTLVLPPTCFWVPFMGSQVSCHFQQILSDVAKGTPCPSVEKKRECLLNCAANHFSTGLFTHVIYRGSCYNRLIWPGFLQCSVHTAHWSQWQLECGYIHWETVGSVCKYSPTFLRWDCVLFAAASWACWKWPRGLHMA